MNVTAYIESGILQDYCLNMLSEHEKAEVASMCIQYPEVQKELEAIQEALAHYAQEAAEEPDTRLQQKIWGTLENIQKEKHGDLQDLPIINKYSDHNNWKRMVMPFIPEKVDGDTEQIQMLRHSDGVTQVLFISSKAIPDETHENEHESFIVLEGECECCIGDNVYRLGPGGFIEIPLYTHHDVKAITPYVIAIMQRIAV